MWIRSVCAALLLAIGSADSSAESGIHFDLPPTAAAQPQAGADPTIVTIDLPLSSVVISPAAPRIDQWLVHCQPRSGSHVLVDYGPRTEVASEITGPIQIKKTNETSQSLGVGLDGSYARLARGHAGVDLGSKEVDSYQLEKHAPVQAVTASGTFDRGRGVFYKLRWTSQQVLEGVKTFQLTLQVPPSWRGCLIDVSVVAQAEGRAFAGFEPSVKTLGAAHFVVAVHRAGDTEAALRARDLFEAESSMRTLAAELPRRSSNASLGAWMRNVTAKFDSKSQPVGDRWMPRLLRGEADPYLDKQIRKLPMPVRVAVLDYIDIRDEFAEMAGFEGSVREGTFAQAIKRTP